MRTAASSLALLAVPIAGVVKSDKPAMLPKMISFQLIRFIIDLLFDDNLIEALLLGEWVNEARETAFLEDRSVNAWFYGA